MFAYDYDAMRKAMRPLRRELLAHVMAPSNALHLAHLGLL
jgi:hypothetical protein